MCEIAKHWNRHTDRKHNHVWLLSPLKITGNHSDLLKPYPALDKQQKESETGNHSVLITSVRQFTTTVYNSEKKACFELILNIKDLFFFVPRLFKRSIFSVLRHVKVFFPWFSAWLLNLSNVWTEYKKIIWINGHFLNLYKQRYFLFFYLQKGL